MAVNPRLFELLAQAKAQPSRAYRGLEAAVGAVNDVGSGYLRGTQIADYIRKRKLGQQTLGESLGGQDLESGIRNFTPEVGDLQHNNIMAEILLRKVDAVANGKPGETLTPEQARAYGVPEDLISSFGGKPIPRQVATGKVNADIGHTRNDIFGSKNEQMAVRGMLQYGGAGAAQPSMKESGNRLANIKRAQGLLAQINSQGGMANRQQRAEFASAAARTLNPTGVMTNEALNLFLPQTAVGKYGDFIQYLQNAPEDVNFAPFAARFGDLLSREGKINQDILGQGQGFARPLGKFVSPKTRDEVMRSLPQPSASTPEASSGSMVTIRDSQGGLHSIPVASIGKAKQRDPGLQVVQ